MKKKVKKKDDNNEDKKESIPFLKTLIGLFRIIKLKKIYFLTPLVLSLITSLGTLYLPYLIQDSLRIIRELDSIDFLIKNILIFFIIAVITLIVSIFSNYSLQILGINTMYELRNKIFRHIQKLSLTYFHKVRAGKIISFITNDADTVNALISSGALNLIIQFIGLIGSLVIMLVLSLRLSMILLIILPINFLVTILFSIANRKKFKQIQEAVSQVTAQMQETINGLRVIKSHKTEQYMLGKFEESVRKERDLRQEQSSIWARLFVFAEMFIYITVGATILYGGYLYFNNLIEFEIVFSYVLYLLQFLRPLGSISQFFNEIQSSIVGGYRILKLMSIKPDLIEEDTPQVMDNPEGSIIFNRINFAYDESDVIHDLSLRIKTNERLAIVGPTGAGKTTLISLLARFYDVNSGSIMIDGVNIKSYSLNSLRKNIGMVLQDNFLFADTILNNIKYGKLNATDEEVRSVIDLLGLNHYIDNLPDGINTKIGERGAILSIGQRQLIAFARTLLADPPILILDEATSSVDAYSEILIQDALEKLLSNRTSIIIAHRLSTIVKSDIIIVMDDGHIIQTGNHQSLVSQSGLYQKLYRMQFA